MESVRGESDEGSGKFAIYGVLGKTADEISNLIRVHESTPSRNLTLNIDV